MAVRLDTFDVAPLYNIKAVVHMTGISPSTLRAWERRYNVCRPQRSASGYRLYSDRDVAIVRWLKVQVDGGMAISQAVAWMETAIADSEPDRGAVLPDTRIRPAPSGAPTPAVPSVQDLATLRRALYAALTQFREAKAEAILAECFSLYPVERVGEEVITPLLIEIGSGWAAGSVSVTTEHYVSNYLCQRLAVLMRAAPEVGSGPEVWVGCAPEEWHEVGSLLVSLFLRRVGFQVRYLGQSVDSEALVADVAQRRPPWVLLSAASEASAARLRHLADRLAQLKVAQLRVGYGGQIFQVKPELKKELAGLYLGDSAREGVQTVGRLWQERARHGVARQ